MTLPDQRVVIYGGQLGGDFFQSDYQSKFHVFNTNTSALFTMNDTFLTKRSYPTIHLLPWVPSGVPRGTYTFFFFVADTGHIVNLTPDNQLIRVTGTPAWPQWDSSKPFYLAQNSASGSYVMLMKSPDNGYGTEFVTFGGKIH
jgi:hypothetical protein